MIGFNLTDHLIQSSCSKKESPQRAGGPSLPTVVDGPLVTLRGDKHCQTQGWARGTHRGGRPQPGRGEPRGEITALAGEAGWCPEAEVEGGGDGRQERDGRWGWALFPKGRDLVPSAQLRVLSKSFQVNTLHLRRGRGAAGTEAGMCFQAQEAPGLAVSWGAGRVFRQAHHLEADSWPHECPPTGKRDATHASMKAGWQTSPAKARV